MITVKAQQKYLYRRVEKSIYYINLFCKQEDEETLHKLRVELKKIKSFVHFTAPNKRLRKKQLRHLQKIFKHAARIRNLHIYRKVTDVVSQSKFVINNAAAIPTEWQNFASNCNLYITYLLELKNSMVLRLTPIADEKACKWFRKQLKKANTKLTGPKTDLHGARKEIKHVLYADGLYKSELNRSYLKKTENALGAWHDIYETLHMLPKTKGPVKRLYRELVKKEQQLKNNALVLAEDFYKKAKK